jgi:transcriptional/translational regulatory protein YebC/TACO1
MIIIEGGKVTEDEVIEMLLDFDVEDIKTEDGNIVITTSPEGYNSVSDFLVKKDFNLLMNQLTYVPKTTVTLDEKKAQQCLRIIELLEDQDDTQEVYSNYDIPDEIMAKISEQ